MVHVAHHGFGKPLSVSRVLLRLDARNVGEKVQKRFLALPLDSTSEHPVDRFVDPNLLVLGLLFDPLLKFLDSLF